MADKISLPKRSISQNLESVCGGSTCPGDLVEKFVQGEFSEKKAENKTNLYYRDIWWCRTPLPGAVNRCC